MTIKDLAAKTGYAVGTVSRALNNHPNVSERARQEILEAAAESGFQLNVNAKQLKQHHSTTILVVVKGIGNELFGEMVESIQTLIAQTHYQLVVDYMDEDESPADEDEATADGDGASAGDDSGSDENSAADDGKVKKDESDD